LDVEHTPSFKLDNGVPIFCKADALVEESGEKCILDWKVSGYGSTAGVSPKAGYWKLWDNGICKLGDKYAVGSLIDLDWADQLCTYGWAYGLKGNFTCIIENIVIRPLTIRTARYKFIIDEAYQQGLKDRYKALWDSLLDGSFAQRVGSNETLMYLLAQGEHWYG
jgi:hypothetical protein